MRGKALGVAPLRGAGHLFWRGYRFLVQDGVRTLWSDGARVFYQTYLQVALAHK
ncbi:MAG: hypothetical protein HRU33_08100 [Rhodobacteraceae bacterium]|nr:hypothetical protein [Paracoccaceae bacterium]